MCVGYCLALIYSNPTPNDMYQHLDRYTGGTRQNNGPHTARHYCKATVYTQFHQLPHAITWQDERPETEYRTSNFKKLMDNILETF